MHPNVSATSTTFRLPCRFFMTIHLVSFSCTASHSTAVRHVYSDTFCQINQARWSDMHRNLGIVSKSIFKSWQVCDWLAKWIIMMGFMDLRWPRVFRRSNVGLVHLGGIFMFYCPSSFVVIVQSLELISVRFHEKMIFFLNFIRCRIVAIYVGGSSLGLPAACRLIAVSEARLPSVDGLVVRFMKLYHHVKPAITIGLQFISNMFTIDTCTQTHRGSASVFCLKKAVSSGLCVNLINLNPSTD